MLGVLKIDPEFEKVIPPLTKDEYHQLEENILDDGRIMMPIAVTFCILLRAKHVSVLPNIFQTKASTSVI